RLFHGGHHALNEPHRCLMIRWERHCPSEYQPSCDLRHARLISRRKAHTVRQNISLARPAGDHIQASLVPGRGHEVAGAHTAIKAFTHEPGDEVLDCHRDRPSPMVFQLYPDVAQDGEHERVAPVHECRRAACEIRDQEKIVAIAEYAQIDTVLIEKTEDLRLA